MNSITSVMVMFNFAKADSINQSQEIGQKVMRQKLLEDETEY